MYLSESSLSINSTIFIQTQTTTTIIWIPVPIFASPPCPPNLVSILHGEDKRNVYSFKSYYLFYLKGSI